MKSRRAARRTSSTSNSAAPLDPRRIDELYGLEPVLEPGGEAEGASLGEYVPLQCPWCGEPQGTAVDLTAGERTYIEDCQVCCRPIELGIELDEAGALRALRAQRLE